jgi:signal transduction histidine kinase
MSARRISNRFGDVSDFNISLVMTVIAAEMLFLLGYLAIPWFQKRLARSYLPVALIFAISGILIEEHLFSPLAGLWQPVPFLYILLILVAWQYTYRSVVAFTLGSALLELILIFFFPAATFIGFVQLGLPAEFDEFVRFGSIVGRSVSFLVLGYIVTSLMKAQRAQRGALTQANQRLVQHAATLEQLTISRERNRISRELHDTLAHTLSAMAVQLDAVVAVWQDIPDKAKGMLDQMLTTTRTGLDETRRALRALRAEPLEEMGLALAVRTLAEDFAARESLELDLEIPAHLDNLSPEVEQCYYRVAQEALENIARHANAKRLAVHMEGNGHGLRMTVSDDGHGFDVGSKSAAEKYGLLGMHERADLIGAQLEVVSHPKQGTKIHLILENGQ